jgi:hypothetical protein
VRVADLYGLPLEEFTRARDELAKELRRAGKKEDADAVRALRKPTVSVWAVNQAARRAPQQTRALVEAGEKLRKAQRAAVSGHDPDALREAQRSHRERLDDLTSFARHELNLAGPNVQRVAQLLRAASVDKDASKSLLAGTLAGDVEDVGFGPLLSLVPTGGRRPARRPAPPRKERPKPKPKPKPEPPRKPKRDPNAARRKRLHQQLDKARERVRELEAQLDELDRR